MKKEATSLGVVVEGSVPIPTGFPPVGEIVSAKISATTAGHQTLPLRTHVLAISGHLHTAITYSAEEKPHALTYLRLKLPFTSYIQDQAPVPYVAQVVHSTVETQHSTALYYSAALVLSPGDSHGL